MTQTGPLRVGVIGCGGIAQMMHLPFLAERPDLFSIEALADLNDRSLELCGQRYHVARLHTDYRRLLEEKIDAVVIVCGGSHRQPVVDAARAGKHVFVEKPLGENLQEVDEVARAVESAGVTLMVGYHKRYDPGYRFAREQIRKLRDLRMVRVEVLHSADVHAREHYHFDPPLQAGQLAVADDEVRDGLVNEVRNARERIVPIVGEDAPLGQQVMTFLLFNSLIHDVNALRGILGEPTEVLHTDWWREGRCIHTVLGFPGEVRAALSWIYLPGLNHYKEELLFVSPESRVTIRFPSPYFKHFPTPIGVETMEEGRFVEREVRVSLEEAFRVELQRFHECVRSGQRPETDLADARGDTLALEKIARAWSAPAAAGAGRKVPSPA
jgi:predicted dehydrogenase